jgi:flagellar hook assembly protein FlgD
VTIANSSTIGLYITTSGAPTITNCAFLGNATYGIYNATPNTPVNALLNYWGAANGPSSPGPGSGQKISAGVNFEPWLMAFPSDPQFFSAASVTNRAFNPSLDTSFTLGFTSALSGTWSITIFNSTGAAVRTLTGHGASGPIAWDGKNDGGTLQSNGTYSYQMASTSDSGQAATVATGGVVVDTSKALTLTSIAITQTYFSPNGDGVQDTTVLTANTNYDDAAWTIKVKNPLNSVVRTFTSTGPNLAFIWDGKDSGGAIQQDGLYTLVISVAAGLGSVSGSAATTLDNTPPSVSITSPGASQVLSNVYAQGVADVTISGLANDANFSSWTLDYGLGTPPASWTVLRSAVPTPANGVLAVWPTLDKANGVYSLRLRAADKAGNLVATSVTPTVGNFKMTQSVLELNPSNGQTQSYVSTVPFQLSESIVIRNASGQVVRTLLGPTTRAAGTHTDPWDGRGDGGSLVADGPYFYVATASEGAYSMTWDLSTQYLADWSSLTHSLPIQVFDPFNNSPMSVTYNFPYPGRVSIALSPSAVLYQGDCNPPNFCPINQEYQESGPHTVTWAGVDAAGAYRGEIRGIGIVSFRDQFAKNAVVVYGSKPRVTNVRVTPPVFGPAVGTQRVEFDLTTNLNQSVEVAVSFLNQSSLSTLRTITIPQQPPGHVTVTWDGRADNGMLVAPGAYTVTVIVTDALGNKSRGQILTTIQY